MEKDNFREFLLEEYKALNESMHKSEETGENRLTFFYTFSTAILGAVLLFLPKTFTVESLTGNINNEPTDKINIVHILILFSLLSLFVIGLIIQRRLEKRNWNTDRLKEGIASIREIFKKNFSDNLEFAKYYDPFPPEKKRRFTSLTDIARIMNILILAIMITLTLFFLSSNIDYSIIAGLGTIIGASILFFWNKKELKHAGGIVFRKKENGETEYMIVTSKQKTDWVLPKGHIEPGEKPANTAVREVIEETGYAAKIIKPIGSINFTFNKEKIISKFFLMTLKEPEGRRIEWVSFDEAAKKLPPDTATILKKAADEIAHFT
ncbi:MAG: NUDIX hydrolase [Chitinophagaceae bacterium]